MTFRKSYTIKVVGPAPVYTDYKEKKAIPKDLQTVGERLIAGDYATDLSLAYTIQMFYRAVEWSAFQINKGQNVWAIKLQHGHQFRSWSPSPTFPRR